ncbi:uroporphyrinogen decarboxylase (URO-D) [Oxobacter pfennigii]|uniref:Uroporphyrinogen decarboxylase (URO-D) n=1 Tax=Oxobacter pfennigii TaxID=36849 RepID=A0A0P8WU25_9CLOT|nr:uroporphyrinogen decarboxylase family protein [Oxobacter pfennigii]KPU46197.1 uroporphyrinogen decarboxylase (URO-D) [Oxobacter pfennigii]
MDSEVKKLQQERISLYDDFYNNKIPKRLPVDAFRMSNNMLAQYGNLNIFDIQYDFSQLAEVSEKVCDEIYSDVCPVPGMSVASRIPSFYSILESQSFVMSGSGFMQHPEVVGMMEEDYDYLIEDAYACLLERVIPRQYKALNSDNTAKAAGVIPMAQASLRRDSAAVAATLQGLIAKKGYYPGPPRGSGGFSAAPYDFLADQLRSFSGISKDIRRNRNKVAEACEALYPLMLKFAMPANPAPQGSVSTPLHMPTYMREKDFVEVWLPTYKRMLEQLAAVGARVSAFCEHDWMRYLDILTELPAGTILRFEYGDPQTIKDKLGKKFIIGGLYPLNLLKSGTKQQCIDKAKELLDIMMPGGGYLFGFDKGAIVLNDINMENYIALSEFIRDYAVYENAGESFGTPLNSEGFKFEPTPVVSKYIFNWEEFKEKYPYTPEFAKANFESLDDEMFKFYMNLLI